jgi:hypothetical protein
MFPGHDQVPITSGSRRYIYILFSPGSLPYRALSIVELQQDIRAVISQVPRLLKDFDKDVCDAAIDYLSSLGAESIYWPDILSSHLLIETIYQIAKSSLLP